ncbi:MAG: ABC-2 transporter permease [Lachnospiraceae bacterium]|nr:ABC-2 transporter permease [Lachnospiraceae bacterium]
MRAIQYMKVDYLLTKQQQRILPVFAILAVFVGRAMGDMATVGTCSYLIFMSTIFSTTPFGSCHRKNTGFLLMLPATVAERVVGRFLYGLAFIAMTALLCVACMGVLSLFGYEITAVTVGLLLCNLALGLFIVALEYLISYIFGEGKSNWQYLSNFVRVAPGMGMFFLFMFIMGRMEEETFVVDRMEFLSQKIVFIGVLGLLASLLVMAAAIAVSVKVIEKRDYA